MKTLKDVLMLFTDELNNEIQCIEYLNSDEDFKLIVGFSVDDDDEDSFQLGEIWLFGDGTTALNMCVNYGGTHVVPDKMIDFYVKIRDTWKNSI